MSARKVVVKRPPSSEVSEKEYDDYARVTRLIGQLEMVHESARTPATMKLLHAYHVKRTQMLPRLEDVSKMQAYVRKLESIQSYLRTPDQNFLIDLTNGEEYAVLLANGGVPIQHPQRNAQNPVGKESFDSTAEIRTTQSNHQNTGTSDTAHMNTSGRVTIFLRKAAELLQSAEGYFLWQHESEYAQNLQFHHRHKLRHQFVQDEVQAQKYSAQFHQMTPHPHHAHLQHTPALNNDCSRGFSPSSPTRTAVDRGSIDDNGGDDYS